MHLNSCLLFEKYAKDYFQDSQKVLEIGASSKPTIYQSLVQKPSIEWKTLDLFAASHVDCVATSEYAFPIPDNTFDVVLSGQVIEHVKKIWVWMKELTRICKPGGRVITIAPVSWPYHEAPVDCWRIYPEGMQALYEDAGLQMELCKFEGLERRSRRAFPGTGQDRDETWKQNLKRRIKIKTNLPMSYSLDTIAIGKKI